MNGEELRRALKSGGIVYGTMLRLCHNPRWASVLAGLNFDYVIIDTEHAAFGRCELADLSWALLQAGVVPLVRIPVPSAQYVTMTLDGGAQGILAPYCETVEQVEEVVGAARWRPLKGALLDRAMDKGEFPSEEVKESLQRSNLGNLVIIGIESTPALENLEAILDVNGIDVIFIGPYDMSISMGIPGQFDHPDFEAMVRRVISLCNARQIAVTIHMSDPDVSAKWIREGVRFVLHGMEIRAMREGFRGEFDGLRAVGGSVDKAGAQES